MSICLAALPYFELNWLDVGLVEVHVFSFLFTLAIAIGVFMTLRHAAVTGLGRWKGLGLVMAVLLAGMASAHLFHVALYEPGLLASDPLALLRWWDGLASTGGVAGGAIALYVLTRRERGMALRWADSFTVGACGAWAVGRLGCALAHDHVGLPSDSPLAIAFPPELLPWGTAHDLGLYEFALVWLPLCVVVWRLGRRPGLRPGTVAAVVAIAYAPARFALEFLRSPLTDPRYAGLTPAQFGVLALAVVGGLLLWRSRLQPSSPAHTSCNQPRLMRSSFGTAVVAALVVSLVAACTYPRQIVRWSHHDAALPKQVGWKDIVERKPVEVGRRPVMKTVELDPVLAIPDSARVLKIGVFPFTETTRETIGLGTQAAVEVETWFLKNRERLTHVDEVKVLGRSQIGSIMTERELADLRLAARRARKARTLDYILAGHISDLGPSFEMVLQCIDVRSTEVIWSEPFSGASVRAVVSEALSHLVRTKVEQATGEYELILEEQNVVTRREPVLEPAEYGAGFVAVNNSTVYVEDSYSCAASTLFEVVMPEEGDWLERLAAAAKEADCAAQSGGAGHNWLEIRSGGTWVNRKVEKGTTREWVPGSCPIHHTIYVRQSGPDELKLLCYQRSRAPCQEKLKGLLGLVGYGFREYSGLHLDESGHLGAGELKVFSLVVSGGQALELKTQAAGDIDLYVRMGAEPTTKTFDARTFTTSGNETVYFTPPADGTLFVAVHGYKASDFELTAARDPGVPQRDHRL